MSIRTDAATAAAPSRYELNSAHVLFTSLVVFVAFGANGVRNAFGWPAWAAIVVALFIIALAWIIRVGAASSLRRLPLPLLAFAALCLLSTAWSNWRPETLAGTAVFALIIVIAIPLAILVSWDELLVGLSAGLRWIVGLSLLFELVVSTFIRHPILPVYLTGITTWQDASLQLLWSRNLLFVDGKIQGIVGNSSILAGVAATALIVVAIQLATKRIAARWGGAWLVLIVGTLLLTRSATLTIALAATAVVLAAVTIRRRVRSFPARLGFLAAIVVVAVASAVVIATQWNRILSLFGKSSDLTGRIEIWQNTIDLAVQHPAFGWGWVGYWPPWVEPLGTLNERYGVFQLHAHNAWIDLWMQVGFVGATLFALIVIAAISRSYRAAITPLWTPSVGRRVFSTLTLLPLLLLVMLVVQSLTESRLIVEEGLLTLAVIAIKLKLDPFVRSSAFATVEN